MPNPTHVFAVMKHGGSYELVSPPVRWTRANPAPPVPIPYEVAQKFLAHDFAIRDERDGTVKSREKQFRFYARYEDIPAEMRPAAPKAPLRPLVIEGAEVNGQPGLVLEEAAPPPSDEPAAPPAETRAPSEEVQPVTTTPENVPPLTRAQAARATARTRTSSTPTPSTPTDPNTPTG